MTKTFTILVHEAEEGGYWAECVELDCGSQGETLDELDFNIRESIEAVLQVRAEDGEDIAAIKKARKVQAGKDVRKWEIAVQLPALAAA
jgi:predicted RNase H-like HicB family nuclease